MKRSGTMIMTPAKRPRAGPQSYKARHTTPQTRYPKSSQDELKFFDTNLAFNVDQTGEVPATGQLTLIPQGVTDVTRIGRKCTIKSVHLRLSMQFLPGASALAATTAFIYLVVDKQTNGAAAAVTDVLTSANMALGMPNLANSDRFVVIKRFRYTFNPPAGVTTAFNVVNAFDEYYKRCNIPIEYSTGGTGAITEIRSNNLFLLAGSDASSDDLVAVTGTCRLRFSD